MRSITLEIGLSDLRRIGDTVQGNQSPETSRHSALDKYERRASSLKQWSRLCDKKDSGAVHYAVSRLSYAAGPVLVTFLHRGHGSLPLIRIAGSFGAETGEDDEELAEQLRFVLGLDYDWIASDAELQSLCAALFIVPTSSVIVSVKRAGR